VGSGVHGTGTAIVEGMMPTSLILGLIVSSWVMIFNREILESIHILIYYYLSFEVKMHCMDTLQHVQAFWRKQPQGKIHTHVAQQMTFPTHHIYIFSGQMIFFFTGNFKKKQTHC